MTSTRGGSAGRRPVLLLVALAVALTACGGDTEDLRAYVDEVKARPPGKRIEPLPEIKPQETFIYAAQNLRSPFVPGGAGGANSSVRPSSNRAREALEQFSLDTLSMKGTLQIRGNTYGLVQTRDGLVHRVQPGNYMGQNEGRIVKIEPSRITLTEIVADSLGGFIERPATLALAE